MGCLPTSLRQGLQGLSRSEPGGHYLPLLHPLPPPVRPWCRTGPAGTCGAPHNPRGPQMSAWIRSYERKATVCFEWTVDLERKPGDANPPRVGSRWEADVGCGKSLLQSRRPTLEKPSLSLQKAEGQGCAQTPQEPRFRAQSAQLSLPFSFLLSFAFLFLLHSCRIRLFSWPLLCLSLLYLSVSQCLSVSLPTSLTLWQCPSRSVSCSQTVSDSMSVLGLWLALPPSSWLLPKASALPSMLG